MIWNSGASTAARLAQLLESGEGDDFTSVRGIPYTVYRIVSDSWLTRIVFPFLRPSAHLLIFFLLLYSSSPRFAHSVLLAVLVLPSAWFIVLVSRKPAAAMIGKARSPTRDSFARINAQRGLQQKTPDLVEFEPARGLSVQTRKWISFTSAIVNWSVHIRLGHEE